jgi:hypothetical protein
VGRISPKRKPTPWPLAAVNRTMAGLRRRTVHVWKVRTLRRVLERPTPTKV